MKETGKRRNAAPVQSKRSGKTEKRSNKPNQDKGGKTLNAKETESKSLKARSDNNSLV